MQPEIHDAVLLTPTSHFRALLFFRYRLLQSPHPSRQNVLHQNPLQMTENNHRRYMPPSRTKRVSPRSSAGPIRAGKTAPESPNYLETPCRESYHVSHSKKRIGVHLSRHTLTGYAHSKSALLLLLLLVALVAHASPQKTDSNMPVVPDLAQRVTKFRPVKMPFNSQGLTNREKQMVAKLVDASGLLDCIYWRQSDPEGLKLYLLLQGSTNPQDELLRRYLKINGSRFDLIDDNKPFVGTQPMPPGRGFFPEDMTRAKFEAIVSKYYPEHKAALYAPQTIVRRNDDMLQAIPYHVAYREFLEPMAKDLREAASLSDDLAFANFLRLRADALLTDDYFASDIAWLDLESPKFDIIFAPYETYLDSLLGVKTSYGASVMIRNEEESKKLAVFQKYVPDLQEALPLSRDDLPSKRGKQSPMEVVDSPYRAGDLLHGYQAVADNLPNDPRIHEQKGSKKIFWKNFMDARVNYIILPLAKRVMQPDQAAMASGEGYLTDTLMHEISHGLGPAFARTPKGKVDIREVHRRAIRRPGRSQGRRCRRVRPEMADRPRRLPERKAERGLRLVCRRNFPHRSFRNCRSARRRGDDGVQLSCSSRAPSTATAHPAFMESASIACLPLIASLAKELLEQEATGDRARTEKWFKKYAEMPPELSGALAKANDIPVDVDPEFDFHPPLR